MREESWHLNVFNFSFNSTRFQSNYLEVVPMELRLRIVILTLLLISLSWLGWSLLIRGIRWEWLLKESNRFWSSISALLISGWSRRQLSRSWSWPLTPPSPSSLTISMHSTGIITVVLSRQTSPSRLHRMRISPHIWVYWQQVPYLSGWPIWNPCIR